MASGRPGLAATRRAVGIIVVLLIFGGAFVFYRLATDLPSSAGSAPTTTESARNQSAGAGSTRVATPSLVPRQSPSGPVPQHSESGTLSPTQGQPGVTAVGVHLSAAPGADGSFDVAESVILDKPVTTLQLRVPPISEGGSAFGSMQPRADSVQISAGGQPVVVPGGQVSGDVSLPLAAPASKVLLRYRLTGVTARTAGSTAGRALAALGPIVAGVPANMPVAINIRGRTVLNLRCPHLRLGDQACSTGSNGNLRVSRLLPWQQSVIVIQFNLPKP
jgi:hypothetical protein